MERSLVRIDLDTGDLTTTDLDDRLSSLVFATDAGVFVLGFEGVCGYAPLDPATLVIGAPVAFVDDPLSCRYSVDHVDGTLAWSAPTGDRIVVADTATNAVTQIPLPMSDHYPVMVTAIDDSVLVHMYPATREPDDREILIRIDAATLELTGQIDLPGWLLATADGDLIVEIIDDDGFITLGRVDPVTLDIGELEDPDGFPRLRAFGPSNELGTLNYNPGPTGEIYISLVDPDGNSIADAEFVRASDSFNIHAVATDDAFYLFAKLTDGPDTETLWRVVLS